MFVGVKYTEAVLYPVGPRISVVVTLMQCAKKF